MKFHEILKDKILNTEDFYKFIDLLDEHIPDNDCLKIELDKIINNGHYSEYTSKLSIEKMIPVAYIGLEGQVIYAENMCDYLAKLGITPEHAHSLVLEEYEKAKSAAAIKGFTAPILNCNKYDAFHSMAMILADYWYTVNGDLSKAAMIAYEYLSDPDKKK